MSYLRKVPPDEKASSVFETIQGAFGFVPNFFRAQTMRSDLIEAEVGLMGVGCSAGSSIGPCIGP